MPEKRWILASDEELASLMNFVLPEDRERVRTNPRNELAGALCRSIAAFEELSEIEVRLSDHDYLLRHGRKPTAGETEERWMKSGHTPPGVAYDRRSAVIAEVSGTK